MSGEALGVIGILALIVLILLRVPVAVALGVVGFLGYAAVDGWTRALLALGATPFDFAQTYSLSVVPLFILMGAVAVSSRMSREMFEAANALFSGRRGALAMATIGASAGFGAISGSSLATAATVSRIAIPEMRRHGYDEAMATGTVAAGGTLGILIPPSVVLIIYAIIAEQSVPALFAAALIPGLLLAALQIGTVGALSALNPGRMPMLPGLALRRRLLSILRMWKLAGLFMLSVGGIYTGWFSPTEAAAVGAFGAILIAVGLREITLGQLADCFLQTVRTSAMLFFVILGAYLFGYFIVQTQIAATLGAAIAALGLPDFGVILMFVLIYIILGCFLDTISMMLITIPVFLPVAVELGYNPVWFGVLVVVVAEIGLLTPPVGLNIFVINAQMPDIPVEKIYAGVLPFILANLLLVLLLVAFPDIALWLPAVLYQ